MTNEYELADSTRESLIYEKQRPAGAAAARAWRQPPHAMRLGDDETPTTAAPASSAELAADEATEVPA